MVKRPNYKLKRNIVRIVLLILLVTLPFLSLSGKPALRFDLYSMNIYLLGSEISVAQIFPLLLGIFSALFLFIFFTQMLGRIWCGWLCPQTILLDCLPGRGHLNIKFTGLKKVKFIILTAIVSVLFALTLSSYTMSPERFFAQLTHGEIHFLWWVLALIIFINLAFIGRRFCRSVCPYMMFQSVMYDADTLRVAFDDERGFECSNCNSCVDACPTLLDIRNGLSNKCLCCAACVDACGKAMAEQAEETPSLVDYFYGNRKFKVLRINRIITLGIAAFFFIASFIALRNVEDVTFKVGALTEDGIEITIKNGYKVPVYIVLTHEGQELNLRMEAKKEETVLFYIDDETPAIIEAQIVQGRTTINKQVELKRAGN